MRSRWIDGSATFTIVLSIETISRLEQQIARMVIRRRSLSSGVRFITDCSSVTGR